MLNYLEYLVEHMGISSRVVCGCVIVFLVLQIIGELLETKGRIVPEVLKVRKYFSRKKREREEILAAIKRATDAANDAKELLKIVDFKYNSDNIAKRDKWMHDVDRELEISESHWCESESHWKELEKKVNETFEVTLSLQIESMRNVILNFANRVSDKNCPVTREEFRRVIGMYEEYEQLIKKHKMENGQINIAYRIIEEEFEERLRSNAFIENIRGYH